MKKVTFFILITPCLILSACALQWSWEWYWYSSLPPASHQEMSPNWSPDEQQLVFVCYRNGPITGWSQFDVNSDFEGVGPDKPWASYTEEAADICVVNRDGSNFRHLVQTTGVDLYPVWSPDGTKIAYSHEGQICLIDPDGTQTYCLTLLTIKVKGDLSWSPQGDKLLFTGYLADKYDDTDIFFFNLINVSYKNLTGNGSTNNVQPQWVKDGSHVFFLAAKDKYTIAHRYKDISMKLIDIEGYHEKTLYGPVLEDVFPLETGDIYFITDLKAASSETYVPDRVKLYKITLDELTPMPVKTHSGFLHNISPSGKYAIYDDRAFKIVDRQTEENILQYNFKPIEEIFSLSFSWSSDEHYLAVTFSDYLGPNFHFQDDPQYESHVYIFDLPNKTVHRLITP